MPAEPWRWCRGSSAATTARRTRRLRRTLPGPPVARRAYSRLAGGPGFSLLPRAGQPGQKPVNAFTVRSFLGLRRGHLDHRRLCLPYGTQQRHRIQSRPVFTELLLHPGADLIMLHDPVARRGRRAAALDNPGSVPGLLQQLERGLPPCTGGPSPVRRPGPGWRSWPANLRTTEPFFCSIQAWPFLR